MERKRLSGAKVLAEWVVFNPAAVVEGHASWPGPSLMASEAAGSAKNRAAIMLALGNLSAELARTRPLGEFLSVRVRPVGGVFMAKAAAVGAVVLPPETLAVKATSPEVPGPAGALEVHLSPADPAFRYWLLPSRDKVCVPYWHLRGAADRADVNCSAEVFRITMLLGPDYDGQVDLSADVKPDAKAPRRLRSKETPEAAADRSQVLTVSIPVLVYSVPVPEGTELRHYVPAPVKRPRCGDTALTLAKVARRKG